VDLQQLLEKSAEAASDSISDEVARKLHEDNAAMEERMKLLSSRIAELEAQAADFDSDRSSLLEQVQHLRDSNEEV
jgi:hypothetical protein